MRGGKGRSKAAQVAAECKTMAELPAKPMALARRVSFFEREVKMRVSSAAGEWLFRDAKVITEGELDGNEYFGSTMLTWDVAKACGKSSDPCDANTTKRLSEMMLADEGLRRRLRTLAVAEAGRKSGRILSEPQIDLRVKHCGTLLRIDADVEATATATRLLHAIGS